MPYVLSPPGSRSPFKERHRMAEAREFTCRRQTRRTRTHDGDALAGCRSRNEELAIVGHEPIDGITLQVADADRRCIRGVDARAFT